MILPQPVQTARHQVVHQIVARRHIAEDRADPAGLFRRAHLFIAEGYLFHENASRAFPEKWEPVFRRGMRSSILKLRRRSEEHTSELQSLMRISYAVFCLKKKK